MDYEFKHNIFEGRVMANFSMGQELIGAWFEEECNQENWSKTQELIDNAQQLPNQEYSIIASGLSISVQDYEVSVTRHHSDHESDDSIKRYEDESLYLDDSIQESHCGLEDFLTAFIDWCEFNKFNINN